MLNIIVLLKRVPDAGARIEIESSGVGIKTDSWILNPYDEFALEEAIRIKERFGATVTAINAGAEGGEEIVKKALAVGADSAVCIKDPLLAGVGSLATARVLTAVIGKMPCDIILCGKRGTDRDFGTTGAALSALLDIPLVSSIKKLTLFPEERRAEAVREAEGRTEVILCPLPALFTADRGLNEPRYPSLSGIMRAKKEKIKFLDTNSIGPGPKHLSSNLRVEKLYYPLKSRRNIILTGDINSQAIEAARFLKEEVKAI